MKFTKNTLSTQRTKNTQMPRIFNTFEFCDKTYNVYKMKHIDEVREGDRKSRGYEIADEGYNLILLEAMKNGMLSYRNSKIVITFFNHEMIRMSVLVEFNDNDIQLISVFKSWTNDDWKPTYITVQNRINMFNCVLPEHSKQKNKKVTVFITKKLTQNKHINKIRKVEK